MKKILVTLAVIVICSCSHLAAQPPGGGGRPPKGDFEKKDNNLVLLNFPDIPGVTLEQRLDLTELVAKEQKEILPLKEQKRIIEAELHETPDLTEKASNKKQKEIDKINSKITKTESNYEKKIKKILNDEQYQFFQENKKNISFNKPPRGRGDGQKQDPRQRPQMNKDDDIPDDLFF